jgi:hypothetical protein
VEGRRPADRVWEIARSDVPVCGINDTLADIPEAARRWWVCVVRDPGGCVLGELPAGKLATTRPSLGSQVKRGTTSRS